ncbi:hypothetical protein IAU60_006541 [Kwoniella sp. DSM 27419]
MGHHIFLPPPTQLLVPLPLTSSPADEIVFHTLKRPQDLDSQHLGQSYASQSLQNRLRSREVLAGRTLTDFTQGGIDSLERSTVLGKRSGEELGPEARDWQEGAMPAKSGEAGIDTTAAEQPHLPATGASGPSSTNALSIRSTGEQATRAPRRSVRRSGGQPDAFLSALPQYQLTPDQNTPEYSTDSLDTTTASFPSQLATNPGNTSMFNFPRWSIALHKLTALQALMSSSVRMNRHYAYMYSIIACVVSTEGLVQRQRKEEKARGGEGSLWIGKWMITAPPTATGDPEVTCGVRLWDDVAREWGERVRRGDVILLENVELRPSSPKEPAHLSLSVSNSPKITILYRTLPRYYSDPKDYVYHQSSGRLDDAYKGSMLKEDRALRPDLRVGRSDAGVKRVDGVARWFAEWVDGKAPC